MRDSRTFVSGEYPVLRSVRYAGKPPDAVEPGQAMLSLGLLVRGIPSFLATIPVPEGEVDSLLRSLDTGGVRVSAVGISVDGAAALEGESAEVEPWRASEVGPTLPAAFLSLICSDGRRIGVARIVSREASTPPVEVARFVVEQIARGVQVPDLASAS